MRIATTRLNGFAGRGRLLLLFFVLCLVGGGCARIKEVIDPKPESEIAIQSGAYGSVTQVTAAKMQDREIRTGDIALTVDLDNGGVVVVIQPEDDIYTVGDRVRVVRDGQGFVRVQLLM